MPISKPGRKNTKKVSKKRQSKIRVSKKVSKKRQSKIRVSRVEPKLSKELSKKIKSQLKFKNNV